VDLGETVDDFLRVLKDQALNGCVVLSCEQKGRLTFHADRRAVKQLLPKLFSNAVKFTPPDCKVVVST